MADLADAGHCLQPTKDLFNPLALPLAQCVARMPRRSGIDRSAPPVRVLRDVRRNMHATEFLHEITGIIAAISADGHALITRKAFEHQQRCVALGGAIGLEHFRRHHQPVAIFNQRFAAIRQLRFVPAALARQSGIGVDSNRIAGKRLLSRRTERNATRAAATC
jgi:hypothetical protein